MIRIRQSRCSEFSALPTQAAGRRMVVIRRGTPRQRHTATHGFSLIELLVVLLILAILIGLLLPAIQGAQANARITQVKTDISTLEAAINSFKADYNIDPPSGIILFEEADDWGNTTIGGLFTVPEIARSRALIRQLWPQFDFSLDRDINGDGDLTDRFALAGAECLVFFLGGINQWNDANTNMTQDQGELIPTGFSKNPLNPFARGGNRQAPSTEFAPTRLILSALPSAVGFLNYLDTLPNQTRPYLYVSSNGGKGYRDGELAGSGMTSTYIQGTSATGPRWNATKFQIISAGVDKEYGIGGPYLPDQFSGQLVGPRAAEQDNITNFHTRTLSTK
jgi:prepilin-type N-terminal cleavage/methylation domain-containing protein